MLPREYEWLLKEPSPAILLEMIKIFGVTEGLGTTDNPIILDWAKEMGLADIYKHDEVPWCGLCVGLCIKRAGLNPIKTPLWAKAWAEWGVAQKTAMLGDILVFDRTGGGGHVGIYVGEDADCFHVMGGNQRDSVCIARILKSRIFAIRRTAWKVAQPVNIRRVTLAATGAPTTNEA